MIKTNALILVFFSLIISFSVVGQPIAKDTSFRVSFNNAASLYFETIGDNLPLYNGSEYIDYDTRINGHQYFGEGDYENGLINYDGLQYNGVPLIYDIVREKVIILRHNNYAKLELDNYKITEFCFLGHHFINIRENGDKTLEIKPGFYDLLYDGEVKVLAKRVKSIFEKISSTQVNAEFQKNEKYYIQKDNRYYQIKSKGAALKVYKDRKKEVSKFLRTNGIKFKENKELAIIKMSEYYDSINK